MRLVFQQAACPSWWHYLRLPHSVTLYDYYMLLCGKSQPIFGKKIKLKVYFQKGR